MKLDRNINANGRGKYALLKLRRLDELAPDLDVDSALRVLDDAGVIDWGVTPETEFFVMRLKDKYADDALFRYALSARHDGEDDYAREVEDLAARAGTNNPFCKRPD